jgi:hypothetical protein
MTETTQTQISYNLTLADVPYDEKYRLNQASASQLVSGLSEMAGRLGEPQNDYQKELYPSLKTIVTKFVEKYTSILQATTEVEKEVRRFNLHGFNGRVKRPIGTKGVKFNLVYKYANFGDYLKTLSQRLTYLVERTVPERYVTNTNEGSSYEQLKTQLKEFITYMKDDVEQSWNTAVTSARTAGGNSVQENLRKRTEKTAEKQKVRQEKQTTEEAKERKPSAKQTRTYTDKTKYNNKKTEKTTPVKKQEWSPHNSA